jgi:hypothetical protein
VSEKRTLGAEGLRNENAIVIERLDTPAYAVAGWGEEAAHTEMIFVRPAPGDPFYPVYLREVPFAREEAVYRTGERGEVFLRALRPQLQAADAALANAWLRRIRQEHGIVAQLRAFSRK